MTDTMPATLGRVVIYRSRTGRYDVPAIVTATTDTLDPQGVELYHATNCGKGVPPLDDQVDSSDAQHVHLTVLTPGLPGFRAQGLAGEADTELAERDRADRPMPAQGYGENTGGTYQEWNVPYDNPPLGGTRSPEPGTWRWPTRV
jgi:hypothetical protein